MVVEKISWEYFKVCNNDVRLKFEDLCRQIFEKEFLVSNKEHIHVHCNPNNPGLESEPIYDENNKRYIGYQAKFFDESVDYNQILHSAQNIVKYYAGQVDHVYLYCNKPLTTSCKRYKDIVSTLKEANISLEPITDVTILDIVRKYPNLALYYFEQNFLSEEWFIKHTEETLDKLGTRYNDNLNIDTKASIYLSLFAHDKRAVRYFNEKKKNLLIKLDNLGWKFNAYNQYKNKIREIVLQIEDIDDKNIIDVLKWDDILKEGIKSDVNILNSQLVKLQDERYDLQKKMYENLTEDKKQKLNFSREDIRKNISEIDYRIELLKELIELPKELKVSDIEENVLKGNILFVEGKAGVGKSHLFANETVRLLEDSQYSLLLLGGDYIDNSPIQEQIVENLRINYSFEELIDILEIFGTENNCIIPIFIDALNETWNTFLWRSGLPAIFNKIITTKFVRLVVSYREEYNKPIFDGLKLDKYNIYCIKHNGFEEKTIEAVQKFLNHYGITFTPLHLFTPQIMNPLFLTLYCKTYQGDEVDLPTLYERILEYANTNIHKTLRAHLSSAGYENNENLVKPIINAIAELILYKGKKIFSKQEVTEMSIWKELGLNAIPFINQLMKENILHSYIYDEKERLYFSYDQMNDYFCAKIIIERYDKKDEIKKYLINDVLKIQEGKLVNYGNRDLFINVCALYAEKYQEECIDIIELIENEYDREEIFNSYINSFHWRKNIAFSMDELFGLFNKYSAQVDSVWEIFIANSVKVNNPFNADVLHKILINYRLTNRDYLWTRYINSLNTDDDNRLMQLIKMYNEGNYLEFSNIKQVELLLTLLVWCFTSSNRWIRDISSKAAIEIMKLNFSLCERILIKFQHVDDPYVIQRLYGVVFGACVKRKQKDKEIYKALVSYVYATIFDCKNVYPDILLRDYARLIIERFFHEFPEEKSSYNCDKIVPPYTSIPIPQIEEQGYLSKDFKGGVYNIISSMRFDGMGMYGDFGRYVFQSALSNFDIDEKVIFNYAIYFILNEIGYNEELLGEYDQNLGRYDYDRHNTIKLERIGKKYQWIAMYNILARVSDHFAMVESFSFEKNTLLFEGPWEPYVRDFDPTLNINFMSCLEVPYFQKLEEYIEKVREENKKMFPSTSEEEDSWINTQSIFFELQKEELILDGSDGNKWISLTKYSDTKHDNLEMNKLLSWKWIYGYFVTVEQEEILTKYIKKKVDLLNGDITWIPETYALYNREYPWSTGSKSFKELSWKNIEIKTGNKTIVTEKYNVPDFSILDKLLKKYDNETKNSNEISMNGNDTEEITNNGEELNIPMHEQIITKEVDVTENIGNILSATVDLLWEEEYDASKEKTILCSVPCAEIIEKMKLFQYEYDGYFYDENGELVAFDTSLTNQKAGIVIRKDVLDNFLKSTNMRLVWFIRGAKEIHSNDLTITKWSDWTGLFTYDGNNAIGEIFKTENSV